MPKKNRQVEKIFKEKRKRRKELACLPVEEKFEILLQLQKMVSPILKNRGLEKQPWMTSSIGHITDRDSTVPDPAILVQFQLSGENWIDDRLFDRHITDNESGYLRGFGYSFSKPIDASSGSYDCKRI